MSAKAKRVAEILLSSLDLELISCTILQTLWAGYGHICAIRARSVHVQSGSIALDCSGNLEPAPDGTFHLILKLIAPPKTGGDEGHLRKMLSYQVEQYFYQEITPLLERDVSVALCITSTRHMQGDATPKELQGVTATLMSDLRLPFPVAGEKRSLLNPTQVYAALDWLAKFHSSSWKLLPDDLNMFLLPPLLEAERRKRDLSAGGDKLWLNGGYTYLATRRKEYASLAEDPDADWSLEMCQPMPGSQSSITEMVAEFLTPRGRRFETYIHGDVKSENLFTTEAGNQVAFFDFQYVGLGLGVCDLAKLFTCSVPLKMLVAHGVDSGELEMDDCERRLLEHYRETLIRRRPADKEAYDYPINDFIRHWETALVDWCRFQASWGFWGNTEWLEARVRSILNDQAWRDWLQNEVQHFTKES